MTPAEFIAALRVTAADPASRTAQAARLVLVEGRSVNGAATELDVHNAPVFRLVRRLREIQQSGCPACGRPLEVQIDH